MLTYELHKLIQTPEEYIYWTRVSKELFMKRNRSGISPDEEAFLELLHTVINEYEQRTFQWPDDEPRVVMAIVMEELGLKQKDLIPYIGTQPRVSDFLRGKANLTAKQIAALSKALHIPAELLLPKIEHSKELVNN